MCPKDPVPEWLAPGTSDSGDTRCQSGSVGAAAVVELGGGFH